MAYFKTLLAFLGLLALLLAPACGGRQETPSPGGQAEEPPADRNGADPGASDDPLKGFTEGSEVPEGWPVEVIPLPPGAAPVASLSKTTVAGTAGEANTVFYTAEQSPEEINALWARELPAKGWTIIDTSPPGEYLVTTAEGNGYVGIFGAGVGFGPAEVSSGKKIAIQIILAKLA